jgi:hypothetical protein
MVFGPTGSQIGSCTNYLPAASLDGSEIYTPSRRFCRVAPVLASEPHFDGHVSAVQDDLNAQHASGFPAVWAVLQGCRHGPPSTRRSPRSHQRPGERSLSLCVLSGDRGEGLPALRADRLAGVLCGHESVLRAEVILRRNHHASPARDPTTTTCGEDFTELRRATNPGTRSHDPGHETTPTFAVREEAGRAVGIEDIDLVDWATALALKAGFGTLTPCSAGRRRTALALARAFDDQRVITTSG